MARIYNPSGTNRFDTLDTTGNAGEFVKYLQGLSNTEFVQQYVQKSLTELGVGEGMSHLEVGCGLAHDLPLIAAAVGKTGKVTLLDNSQTMQQEALDHVEKLGNDHCTVSFKLGDAHKLPFPDETFDTSRVVRVLQHLENPQLVISEMARVLKPGARLCAIEPNWMATVVNSNDNEVTKIFLSDLHSSIRNPGIGIQLRQLCTNAGLSIGRFEVLDYKFLTLEEAASAITFDDRIAKLVEAKVFTRQRFEAWLKELKLQSEAKASPLAMIPFGFIVAQK